MLIPAGALEGLTEYLQVPAVGAGAHRSRQLTNGLQP
jgi:hypothetical protein